MPEKPTCATCRFWKAAAADADTGFCHRWPPVDRPPLGACVEVGFHTATFTQTQADQWCGEHQPNTTTIHLSSGVTDADIGTKGHGGHTEPPPDDLPEGYERCTGLVGIRCAGCHAQVSARKRVAHATGCPVEARERDGAGAGTPHV